MIKIKFATAACRVCAARAQCTRSVRSRRTVTIRPQAQHEVLQAAREREATQAFKEEYARRAGVEGTAQAGGPLVQAPPGAVQGLGEDAPAARDDGGDERSASRAMVGRGAEGGHPRLVIRSALPGDGLIGSRSDSPPILPFEVVFSEGSRSRRPACGQASPDKSVNSRCTWILYRIPFSQRASPSGAGSSW